VCSRARREQGTLNEGKLRKNKPKHYCQAKFIKDSDSSSAFQQIANCVPRSKKEKEKAA
jgi:hypothetical protein